MVLGAMAKYKGAVCAVVLCSCLHSCLHSCLCLCLCLFGASVLAATSVLTVPVRTRREHEQEPLKISVVPVGLNYFSPHRFRSTVSVDFGDPIEVDQVSLPLRLCRTPHSDLASLPGPPGPGGGPGRESRAAPVGCL